MPYCEVKEYARGRNRKLETLLKKRRIDREKKSKAVVDGRKEILENTTTYALEEIYNEACNMYDAYISKYYEYKTEVYIRHGETSPGTRKGHNLYLAKEFDIDYSELYLDVNNFEPENMESYRWATQDEVFDTVINGHRGVIDKKRPKRYMDWSYDYEGKYYTSDKKTIKEAFDDFDSKLNDIFKSIRDPLFFEEYGKLRRSVYGGN